ncbi:tetratricopeptide repeat protein, partial [Ostertagia ostertagi]
MGSHKGYFAPSSRTEEVVLLLLISEVLSTREVVLSRSADVSSSRHQSIRSAKSVYNLLTLVLSTLRQYHLLSTIYERAMKFVNQDEFLWQQFALSLVCRGRWLRAVRVLEQCIAAERKDSNHSGGELEPVSSNTAMHHMQAAVLHMEHLGQNDAAINHAMAAVALCSEGPLSYLKGRAQLLRKAQRSHASRIDGDCSVKRWQCSRTSEIWKQLVNVVPRSLELNAEQPAAIMLLALIFTAEADLKGALELVVNALKDFPTHYGLLVLRLHIETKFGRIDESLGTCSYLLDFWRKRDCCIEDERVQLTLNVADGQSMLKDAPSVKAGTPSIGRELSSSTPLFATPLGIGITADSGVPASEVGGQSASSEGGGVAGSASSALWTRFRAQANMWMALAELFLAEGRLNDVAPCVEQAAILFPHAHQALYLKGRLFAAKAEKAPDEATAAKFRAESNGTGTCGSIELSMVARVGLLFDASGKRGSSYGMFLSCFTARSIYTAYRLCFNPTRLSI